MAKNPRIDRDWRDPIRKSEIATDFGISLARVQWDFFATLTFAGNVPRTQIAYGLAYRWLQELAKVCGVPYKRLLIALRGEEGEKHGRFHFHCLVGGTATRNYHTLQHQAEHLWKIQTGGARVEVRQYDRALAGAEYVCKCLGAKPVCPEVGGMRGQIREQDAGGRQVAQDGFQLLADGELRQRAGLFPKIGNRPGLPVNVLGLEVRGVGLCRAGFPKQLQKQFPLGFLLPCQNWIAVVRLALLASRAVNLDPFLFSPNQSFPQRVCRAGTFLRQVQRTQAILRHAQRTSKKQFTR
jgi:hypothetical protein